MPQFIAKLLDTRFFGVLARTVLTFVFWGSGLSKLIDFRNGVAEMAHYGLEPAILFNVASIVVLLGGSALVILDRRTWLGCGALATFTVLTIPIAHRFWAMPDPQESLIHFFFVTEHVSLIGGLMVMSILSRRKAASTASEKNSAFVGGRIAPQ